MATVKYAVKDVSNQLNDQERGNEFVRWSVETVIGYISDGLAQIGLYRPDAFTTLATVTLVPGVRQMLPDGITTLSSIADPLTVTSDDFNLLRAFSKKVCNYDLDEEGNVVYKLSSYAYDPRNPKYFYVSPPVPLGLNPPATIKINGVISPPMLKLSDWLQELPVDNKYYNALVAFALSKAYEVDTESDTSHREMLYQRGEFYNMMGIKYKQESKFNSGWYLGARGDEAGVKGQQ